MTSGRIQSVLDNVQAIHDACPRGKHPLWAGLVAGEFTKKQVGELIRQAGIIPLHNNLYHGPLYVICPDPEWREMLAEVVYEEGTGKLFAGGNAHYRLYLRLGEAFGISKEEMWNTDYCPEAVAFRSYFHNVCSKNFLEGVSAHMLGAEAPVPAVFNPVSRALKEQFDLSDEDIAFYTVHEEADSEHSDIGRQLLERFTVTEDDIALVLKSVKDMVTISNVLWNGIYERVKAAA
mgnify:CR=1 FL=1